MLLSSRFRSYGLAHVLLMLALLLGAVSPLSSVRAQVQTNEPDVAVLTGWPASLSRLLDDMGRRAPRLLPEIDSLALEYRYANDTRADVVPWSFQLSWRPGRQVLYEGRVLHRADAPSGLRMVSVELLADVIVDGQKRAEMVVAVDSMRLAPQGAVYRFDVPVGYDRVFLETSADAARRYLERGVTLANLQVERIGFIAEGMGDGRPPREPDMRERRPAPDPRPSVYEPRVRILIGWRIGPDPYYVGSSGRGDAPAPRTERPRGDTGRTPSAGDARARGGDRGSDRSASGDDTTTRGNADTEEASGASGRTRSDRGSDTSDDNGDDNNDNDDEDDDDLLTPALIAAGAVGTVAVLGGTVGVFGTGDTPIGLTGGYTQPKGGIWLQAAINSAVIDDEGTQRLTVKGLGFYDVFGGPIQPSIGLGVQAKALGDDTTVDPSLSVGLVGRAGRMALYGGVDVVQGTPEVGLSINFRSSQ